MAGTQQASLAEKQQLFFSQEIDLLIRDRQTVLFQGKVAALTTRNEDGVLDIIPEHTQFISIIKEYIVLTKKDGSTLKIPIDTGIIKVVHNAVNVYLGIFSLASEKKGK